MAKSVIRVTVPLSLEETFLQLSDHENMKNVIDEISFSELLTEGEKEKNGLGAIRKLKFNSDLLVEKVINWIPPGNGVDEVGYDYKVISNNVFIADHLGVIRITKEGEKSSHIAWDIDLKVPVWATGEIAAYFVCRSMEKELSASLKKNLVKT